MTSSHKARGIDWGDLQELYSNRQLSVGEIAKIKDCHIQSVLSALRRRNIPRRSHSQSGLLMYQKGRHPIPNRERCPWWRGGRVQNSHGQGYVYIRLEKHDPFYPMVAKDGYVLEHRLVVAKRLGRCLLRSEKVHHINGVRYDNRDDNLELLSGSNHQLKELFCKNCPLKARVKLLEWRVTELEKELQYKLEKM